VCVLLLALGASGCATHPPPPISDHALNATRRFGDFAVYWAGRRFEGIAVTAADRADDYDHRLGMRVYYGDCIGHRSPLASGGCTLPLEVNSVLYKPHSNRGLGPQRPLTLRGVPAVAYDQGRSIELYTGHLAVDVFADSPGRALRAAQALVPLNIPGATTPGSLPPPLFDPGEPGPPTSP